MKKTDSILCFDLDGTLLDHEGRIHPKDIDLLKKYNNYQFVVTTGRSRESVRKSFNLNGIFMHSIIPIPMILLNGALIYASNERFISYHPFTQEIQFKLLKPIKHFPDITFLLLNLDDIHLINPTPFGMRACKRFEFNTIPLSDENVSVSFSKLMCISPELSDLKNFSILSSKLPVEIAMSMEFVLEITPSGINKAVGLQRLINDLQIENRNILAAGDGGNDVQLFSLASSSFVPDNAPDKIKSYADFIINRNKSGILSPMIYSLCELQ